MAEQIFAGTMLAVALALLVRLALGERGRSAVARAWSRVARRLRRRPLGGGRIDARDAERIAAEAIRRARTTSVDRDGNVYVPKSFKRPRRDRNLH